MSNIDVSNVTITQTAEEGTDLVTRDGEGNVISSIPLPSERVNQKSLESKIDAAVDNNVDWINDHPARQAALNTMKADILPLKTVTVTNVAQAQAAMRQLAGIIDRSITGLDQLEARLLSLTKQVTAIERMIANKLDSTDGTD